MIRPLHNMDNPSKIVIALGIIAIAAIVCLVALNPVNDSSTPAPAPDPKIQISSVVPHNVDKYGQGTYFLFLCCENVSEDMRITLKIKGLYKMEGGYSAEYYIPHQGEGTHFYSISCRVYFDFTPSSENYAYITEKTFDISIK